VPPRYEPIVLSKRDSKLLCKWAAKEGMPPRQLLACIIAAERIRRADRPVLVSDFGRITVVAR
jgi:hypothetical protein